MNQSFDYQARVSRLQDQLNANQLDAILIGNLKNIQYLTGFRGTTGYLLISADSVTLYVDGRYTLQAGQQAQGATIHETIRDVLAGVLEHIGQLSLGRCGFEAGRLIYADYDRLRTTLPAVTWVPTLDMVEQLRARKDAAEIDAIRRAMLIADAAFHDFTQWIEPGMIERDVAARLEQFQRIQGGDRKPSETVVASGTRTSFAHGLASDRTIGTNEPVMIDIGIVIDGYTSDLTRTVFLGKPPDEFKKIYQIVLDAQARAIEGLRPGMLGREIDALARQYIDEQGYGAYFGHGLGHSLGLEIHEKPVLSTLGAVPIEPGMVVTVEPGIYLPGRYGVRTEDVVVVTDTGCEVLTTSEHELQLIGL